MAFVPGFEHDVFISYSHLDNQSVDKNNQVGRNGWVSAFHSRLQVALDQLLGADVDIWRDERLDSVVNFPSELSKQLRGTAVLLAVVSPGYLNSRWCEWELSGFVGGDQRTGDLLIDNRYRAVKVVKLPGDNEAHRDLAPRESTGLELFETDKAADRVYELELDSPEFKRRLTNLTQDIAGVLKRLRRSRTVYLGVAPPGMVKQRHKVGQELEAQRFKVLRAPHEDAADAVDVIQRAMRDSSLSIRFVDRQGDQPTGVAAAERATGHATGMRQVVVVHDPDARNRGSWDLSPEQPSKNVEVLVDPPTHALNETVLQTLRRQEPGAGNELVEVYLICERQDHPFLAANPARHLRDHLRSRGFEVKVPLAEGDDATFSKDNRSKLKSCDGVMLYWGGSQQGWFEERLRELRKAEGWRGDRKAFASKGAYVAGPPTPVKEHFETREVQELIKQFAALDPGDERLARFIARLEQREHAG